MTRGARMLGIAVLVAVMAALSSPAFSQPAGNAVVQWNETTMNVIDANGQIAVQSTRTLAMVHAAAHDALNAINRRYDAYYFEGPGDAGASPDAAVAAAAHTVLVGVIGGLCRPPPKRGAPALPAATHAAAPAHGTH